MYLSLVDYPPSLAPEATSNILWVGFQTPGGPVIGAITLSKTTPASDQPAGAGYFATGINTLDTAHGDILGAMAAAPWDQVNVWIVWTKPSVPPDNVATAPDSWAVQMRVPLANLATVGTTFPMWFEVADGTPGSPSIALATWPRTGANVSVNGSGMNQFPDPSVWLPFSYTPGCMAPGVSLSYLQIGVENNTPNSLIKYAQVPPAASHPSNTFFARPTNNSGMDLPMGSIKATFRIANWGSMANPENWEAGVSIDDLWAKIECFANDNNGTTPTACGTDVPNQFVQFRNGTTATQAMESTFGWALSNMLLLPFASGMRTVEKCLLVQLTSTGRNYFQQR